MDHELQSFYDYEWPAAAPEDSFHTESRARLMDQATGELSAGCNVLTIRGCRGVGKTHLGLHLASRLRARGDLVVRASGAVHDAAQMRRLIAQACGPGGGGTQRLVLFVDDAKACPAGLFTYLWSLVARRDVGAPAIQLVLLGEVGPWPGLNGPGLEDLREASTSCYILVPFEDDEAAAYVRHRLAQAGRKRRRLVGRAALADVVGQSHGVAALLNARVSDALVRSERLRRARGTTAPRRSTGAAGLAGWKPRRPALALASAFAVAVTLAASAVAPPLANPRPLPMPSSIRLLSSVRFGPVQTLDFAPLARQLAGMGLDGAPEPAVPEVRTAASPGPGLVLVAAAGDDIRVLYDKVYRGVTPPPYTAVLAANRSPVKAGTLVIFPEPPHGWLLR